MYDPQLTIMPNDPVYKKFSIKLNEDGTPKLRVDGKVTLVVTRYNTLKGKETGASEFPADANEIEKVRKSFEERYPKDLPRPGVSNSAVVNFLGAACMLVFRAIDKAKGNSLTIDDVKKHNQDQIDFLKNLQQQMSAPVLDASLPNLPKTIGCTRQTRLEPPGR